MNCILYGRVSTDKQFEKELSIPAQLQAMRDHARQHGWMIVGEFVEPGASATTADRPELQRMLERIRKADVKVDIVLVHKLDRIARNLEDHVMIRATLKRAGVRIASVIENVDESVSGQLVENIMASIAQFYSANLGEEAKKGMRMLVQKGGWPHRPPKGYRIVRDESGKGRIVLDPDKAPVLKEAFARYAGGLWSLNRLRLQLAEIGLVTGRGLPLSQEMLRKMLTNPFYAGRLRWKGAEYPGSHEPLIQEDLFQRVQQVLRLRHRDSGEKGKYHFLLRGFSYCAECGGKLTAEHHPRGSYYRCVRNTLKERSCRAPFSNVTKAHQGMESVLDQLTIAPAFRTALLEVSERLIDDKAEGAQRRLRSVVTRKVKLESREVALTEAFASGELSRRAYRAVMETLRTQLAGLDRAIAECKLDPEVLRRRVRDTLQCAEALKNLYDYLDEPRRSQLLRLVFAKLVLDKGDIIHYELQSPFDVLFLEPPSRRTPGDSSSRSTFDNRQIRPAITAILEHDVSPILALSESQKAA